LRVPSLRKQTSDGEYKHSKHDPMASVVASAWDEITYVHSTMIYLPEHRKARAGRILEAAIGGGGSARGLLVIGAALQPSTRS
jgi:hypothetical protein